jgi:hypothetical protein
MAMWELMGPVLDGSTTRMIVVEACGYRWWLKETTALVGTALWDVGFGNCWCGMSCAACATGFWWLGLFAGLGLGGWS